MSTVVYIQNDSKEALTLSTLVEPYLAPEYWAALADNLPGFMTSYENVLKFNRNDGIADGAVFVFTTSFTLGGTSVSFLEQLTGTWDGSKLAQQIIAGSESTGWQDFSGEGPTFSFTAANGVKYDINWDLKPGPGLYDDIYYTISIA